MEGRSTAQLRSWRAGLTVAECASFAAYRQWQRRLELPHLSFSPDDGLAPQQPPWWWWCSPSQPWWWWGGGQGGSQPPWWWWWGGQWGSQPPWWCQSQRGGAGKGEWGWQ